MCYCHQPQLLPCVDHVRAARGTACAARAAGPVHFSLVALIGASCCDCIHAYANCRLPTPTSGVGSPGANVNTSYHHWCWGSAALTSPSNCTHVFPLDASPSPAKALVEGVVDEAAEWCMPLEAFDHRQALLGSLQFRSAQELHDLEWLCACAMRQSSWLSLVRATHYLYSIKSFFDFFGGCPVQELPM